MAFLVAAGLTYLAVFNLPLVNAYTQFFALNFLCAPAIAVILFCVSRYDTPFARVLGTAPLVALGETSYSIYLVHTWTLRLFEQTPQPFTGFWLAEAGFRVVCAIAFTLLVSYATYRLIELPGRVWTRRVLNTGIARIFEGRSGPAQEPRAVRARPPKPARQVAYTGLALIGLAGVALGGQVLQYDYGRKSLHRLLVGYRPEIEVITATYGASCEGFPVPPQFPYLVAEGNATKALRQACDERTNCDFEVSIAVLGDPANGCGKDFSVEYRCTGQSRLRSAYVAAEAVGHHVHLVCPNPSR